MKLYEYRQLLAEKGEFDKLLAELPVDRVVERMGLEARKQEIQDTIATKPSTTGKPGRQLDGFSHE
jgi:hypothetical protein